jgi:hypothetical protein
MRHQVACARVMGINEWKLLLQVQHQRNIRLLKAKINKAGFKAATDTKALIALIQLSYGILNHSRLAHFIFLKFI